MNWPTKGCHDPDSCYRHQRCMYIRCPWQYAKKEDLIEAMKKAADARANQGEVKQP